MSTTPPPPPTSTTIRFYTREWLIFIIFIPFFFFFRSFSSPPKFITPTIRAVVKRDSRRIPRRHDKRALVSGAKRLSGEWRKWQAAVTTGSFVAHTSYIVITRAQTAHVLSAFHSSRRGVSVARPRHANSHFSSHSIIPTKDRSFSVFPNSIFGGWIFRSFSIAPPLKVRLNARRGLWRPANALLATNLRFSRTKHALK